MGKHITLSGSGFNGGPLTMSSLEIADLLGSRHDKVKLSIERLAARGVITLPPLRETSFVGADGRKQTTTEYRVEKRDSYIVVAQLSPEFTAKLVDRWQELEAKAAGPAIPDFTNPAIAARAWAEQFEARQIAERTKAEIGSRREATAMATASRAVRESKKLQTQLGQMTDFASVKRMEKFHKGQKFPYHPLKKGSLEKGLPIIKIEDPNYGAVNTYHADVWREVYGLDIPHLEGHA